MARTLEADILVPTLKALATYGTMNAAQRLEHLSTVMPLSDEDNETLEGRQDSRFSQIVRNQVSHRTMEGNIVFEGYATYEQGAGLTITSKGRKLISR